MTQQEQAIYALHYAFSIRAADMLDRFVQLQIDDLDSRKFIALQNSAQELIMERTEAIRKHFILYPD